MGWVGGGGLQHLSVSPRPLGLGSWVFGAKGLGPGLDNKLIMINYQNYSIIRNMKKPDLTNAIIVHTLLKLRQFCPAM